MSIVKVVKKLKDTIPEQIEGRARKTITYCLLSRELVITPVIYQSINLMT